LQVVEAVDTVEQLPQDHDRPRRQRRQRAGDGAAVGQRAAVLRGVACGPDAESLVTP
jgi:hypothetical protein